MEWLKEFLGDELYAQVEAKLKGNDKVKLINCAGGEYVSANKYNDKIVELSNANQQITDLTNEVNKFKQGDDLVQLKKDLQALQDKYNSDVVKVQKESLLREELMNKGAKYPDLILSKFDLEKVTLKDNKIDGFTDQLKDISSQYADLFEAKQAGDKDPTYYKPKAPTQAAPEAAQSFVDIIKENQVRK